MKCSALLEKDLPIKRLRKTERIDQKLNLLHCPPCFLQSEKIRLLERWLSNIQERRKT
jgi:hypothetical protein